MERINHHSHVTERLMFLPTGEVFMDEQNSTLYHSDFLFSGKEVDEETGRLLGVARLVGDQRLRRQNLQLEHVRGKQGRLVEGPGVDRDRRAEGVDARDAVGGPS